MFTWVRSLLRRYKGVKPANPNFDPQTNRVELGGRVFNLTPTEFRLFSCLALNQGKVVPYSELIADVWGRKISPDTIHLYIRRLKQRLGIDSVGPYRLLKYRGQGCCFAEDKTTVRTNREVMPIDNIENEYSKSSRYACR
jgi:DNA-binding response OmpR family regulator